MDEIRKALRDLVEASEPFTSGDVVDETSGTIPLMKSLDDAIKAARELLKQEDERWTMRS